MGQEWGSFSLGDGNLDSARRPGWRARSAPNQPVTPLHLRFLIHTVGATGVPATSNVCEGSVSLYLRHPWSRALHLGSLWVLAEYVKKGKTLSHLTVVRDFSLLKAKNCFFKLYLTKSHIYVLSTHQVYTYITKSTIIKIRYTVYVCTVLCGSSHCFPKGKRSSFSYGAFSGQPPGWVLSVTPGTTVCLSGRKGHRTWAGPRHQEWCGSSTLASEGSSEQNPVGRLWSSHTHTTEGCGCPPGAHEPM